MNGPDVFDIVIIGAGPAGYSAAIRAAQLGFSVVVAEKEETLGGTCLNVGCIPSKALLDSSEHFSTAKSGLAQHGVLVEKAALDLAAMMERKNRIVATLTGGIETLFKRNRIAVVRGTARFSGPREIEIISGATKEKRIAGRAIIIASGSAPVELPSLRFDGATVVDSTGALAFDKVPGRLAVIGGGAVGLELASVWSRLGSRVTVVEQTPNLLPGWDETASRLLKRILAGQGIAIMTGASVTGAAVDDAGARLTVETEGKREEIAADRVLVAVGRRPDIKGLGLDKIGISADAATGRVRVDEKFMTACKGVYAAGDCVGGPMLAHKAFAEACAAVETIAGKAASVNYGAIPGVVYTSPEIAFVGATEKALIGRNVSFKKGTFPFRANGRALSRGTADGFVTVLADAQTDAVLGVHIIGPQASECIAEAVSVMEFGGSSEDIARTVHAHPTLSEAIREAALDVGKMSIHK